MHNWKSESHIQQDFVTLVLISYVKGLAITQMSSCEMHLHGRQSHAEILIAAHISCHEWKENNSGHEKPHGIF